MSTGTKNFASLSKHVPFQASSVPTPISNLSTDRCVQVDRLWAAVNNLVRGGAVAGSLARRAVEDLATVARGQNVVLVSEGVAPLCAELV